MNGEYRKDPYILDWQVNELLTILFVFGMSSMQLFAVDIFEDERAWFWMPQHILQTLYSKDELTACVIFLHFW